MGESVVAGVRGEGLTGGEAWREVCDAVVAGICHDLNDRLSALSGIVQLARLDGLVDETVGDTLQSELEKVEDLVRLLRTLPAGRVEEPEPVRLADVVATVAALLRRHRGLEDVRVDLVAEADPIVRTEWSSLARGVLLVVAAAARDARARSTDRVVVRLTVESATAVLAVEAAEDADPPGGCGAEPRLAGSGSVEPHEADDPETSACWAGGVAEMVHGALAGLGGEARLRPPGADAWGDPSPAGVELRLPVWSE